MKADSYEYPLIVLDNFKTHFYDLVILDDEPRLLEITNNVGSILAMRTASTR
jgi:hypothetical protein